MLLSEIIRRTPPAQMLVAIAIKMWFFDKKQFFK